MNIKGKSYISDYGEYLDKVKSTYYEQSQNSINIQTVPNVKNDQIGRYNKQRWKSVLDRVLIPQPNKSKK